MRLRHLVLDYHLSIEEAETADSKLIQSWLLVESLQEAKRKMDTNTEEFYRE